MPVSGSAEAFAGSSRGGGDKEKLRRKVMALAARKFVQKRGGRVGATTESMLRHFEESGDESFLESRDIQQSPELYEFFSGGKKLERDEAYFKKPEVGEMESGFRTFDAGNLATSFLDPGRGGDARDVGMTGGLRENAQRVGGRGLAGGMEALTFVPRVAMDVAMDIGTAAGGDQRLGERLRGTFKGRTAAMRGDAAAGEALEQRDLQDWRDMRSAGVTAPLDVVGGGGPAGAIRRRLPESIQKFLNADFGAEFERDHPVVQGLLDMAMQVGRMGVGDMEPALTHAGGGDSARGAAQFLNPVDLVTGMEAMPAFKGLVQRFGNIQAKKMIQSAAKAVTEAGGGLKAGLNRGVAAADRVAGGFVDDIGAGARRVGEGVSEARRKLNERYTGKPEVAGPPEAPGGRRLTRDEHADVEKIWGGEERMRAGETQKAPGRLSDEEVRDVDRLYGDERSASEKAFRGYVRALDEGVFSPEEFLGQVREEFGFSAKKWLEHRQGGGKSMPRDSQLRATVENAHRKGKLGKEQYGTLADRFGWREGVEDTVIRGEAVSAAKAAQAARELPVGPPSGRVGPPRPKVDASLSKQPASEVKARARVEGGPGEGGTTAVGGVGKGVDRRTSASGRARPLVVQLREARKKVASVKQDMQEARLKSWVLEGELSGRGEIVRLRKMEKAAEDRVTQLEDEIGRAGQPRPAKEAGDKGAMGERRRDDFRDAVKRNQAKAKGGREMGDEGYPGGIDEIDNPLAEGGATFDDVPWRGRGEQVKGMSRGARSAMEKARGGAEGGEGAKAWLDDHLEELQKGEGSEAFVDEVGQSRLEEGKLVRSEVEGGQRTGKAERIEERVLASARKVSQAGTKVTTKQLEALADGLTVLANDAAPRYLAGVWKLVEEELGPDALRRLKEVLAVRLDAGPPGLGPR